MSRNNSSTSDKGTLKALLKEPKRQRGRPRSILPRKSVYIELSPEQKIQITTISKQLLNYKRADVPDMAVITLAAHMGAIKQAVSGRAREMPEGITDIQSLYFLWDLSLPPALTAPKWTSIRLSPQQVDEFGSIQGRFNLLFGANRSQVFTLGLTLLNQIVLNRGNDLTALTTLDEYNHYLVHSYL